MGITPMREHTVVSAFKIAATHAKPAHSQLWFNLLHTQCEGSTVEY